jgi:hypothetical protein
MKRLPVLFENNIFDDLIKNNLINLASDYLNKNSNHFQILIYNKYNQPCGYQYSINDYKINSFIENLNLDIFLAWIMVYPPDSATGYHSDDIENEYRYVYELQSSDNSYFSYINENEYLKIIDFNNKILYIGDLRHSFENRSNEKTRISLVFDTKLKIH